jgi:hypothetical protein
MHWNATGSAVGSNDAGDGGSDHFFGSDQGWLGCNDGADNQIGFRQAARIGQQHFGDLHKLSERRQYREHLLHSLLKICEIERHGVTPVSRRNDK